MTLRDNIINGGFDLSNRNDAEIARQLSIGQTQIVQTFIGYGTVLDTIGLEAGNAFLNILTSDPRFKYILPLLEQGRLDIGMQSVRTYLDQLATAGVLSAENAQLLKSLAEVPVVIPVNEVSIIINEIQGIPT